ncbi:MAG: AMP-binding protein, partial [Nitrososphaera sp.]|nr:AMP-binding protein [Nitrososphaera sp.]
MIGLFVNTVVTRTDCSGNPGFVELLQRVRESTLRSLADQDLPFSAIVEELNPKRNLNENPVFQVFFNSVSLPEMRLDLPELTIEISTVQDAAVKFDLSLYAIEKGGGIDLQLAYNTAIFGVERIEEMLRQLKRILAQAIDAPETKIESFSLLTSQFLSRLPDPRGKLMTCYDDELVLAGFLRQVAVRREAKAVEQGGIGWTYLQLDDLSNRVAVYLRQHQIHSGDVVAILAERNRWLVVALLGILKTGASFLILDNTYPAARLLKCSSQARPKGWIRVSTTISPEVIVAAKTSSFILDLTDDFAARTVPERTELQRIQGSSGDVAYIAFTSGSTGMPKGIVATQRPLTHFLKWYTKQFRFQPEDRFSMLSGLSHDPLLREIFTPLSTGGSLVIPEEEDMQSLGLWLRNKQITV